MKINFRSTLLTTLALVCGVMGTSPAMGATEHWLRQGGTFAESISQQLQKLSTSQEVNQSINQKAKASTQFLKVNQSSQGKHIRYQQYHKGIPVWGKQVLFHKDSNLTTGNILSGIEGDLSNLQAKFSPQEAVAIAQEKSRQIARNEKVELVIVQHQGQARLAYVINFLSLNSKAPSRPFFIIDAQTKDILRQWEGIQHSKLGTGYGGNVKTGKYHYGTDYGKLDVVFNQNQKCVLESSKVKTVNLNHSESRSILSPAHSFDCFENETDEVNGAYSVINDAHYFGDVVFDLYQNWFQTSPLPFRLTLFVHYGTGYENAFWDGSSMTFGDGDKYFYPLVSLDVVAHEVSHGFTEFNSNLVYTAQSGGLNEAFSDMSGEAAEFYMKGSNDFLIGADIYKSQPGDNSDDVKAMRYVCEPPKDGASIGHTKDYNDGLDVHLSSGIYNKAFCLLAKTEGWGTQKAFEVMVKANQNYWTPNTTFNEAGCGVLYAARDLGRNIQDVTTALQTVGVQCFTKGDFDENGELNGGDVIRYQQCVLHKLKESEGTSSEERNQNLGISYDQDCGAIFEITGDGGYDQEDITFFTQCVQYLELTSSLGMTSEEASQALSLDFSAQCASKLSPL